MNKNNNLGMPFVIYTNTKDKKNIQHACMYNISMHRIKSDDLSPYPSSSSLKTSDEKEGGEGRE